MGSRAVTILLLLLSVSLAKAGQTSFVVSKDVRYLAQWGGVFCLEDGFNENASQAAMDEAERRCRNVGFNGAQLLEIVEMECRIERAGPNSFVKAHFSGIFRCF